MDAEVNIADAVFANVFGPHAGERLTHCTHGVFHCAILYGLFAGGGTAISITCAPDLEERDGVLDSTEEGVKVIVGTKCCPAGPMVINCCGT